MKETALIPYVPPTLPPPRRTNRAARLERLVFGVLAVFSFLAVLVYGFAGAELVSEWRIDGTWAVRQLVGNVVGGASHVYSLPDIADVTTPEDAAEEFTSDRESDGLTGVPYPGSLPSYTNAETPYEIDISEILSLPRTVEPLAALEAEYGTNEPVVLILHTHGTEAYADHAADQYRTDGKDGVIGIGEVIAEEMKKSGIHTLHCELAFDAQDFNLAYYSASLALKEYIKEYPSIRYVIDVHRDSLTLADGTAYAPVTLADGEKIAQLMFVVGTDYAGSGHTGWRDNLALAARLSLSLEERLSGVMRPLNIRAASFNEQYSPGSLLVEIGSAANTYEEAERAAKLFADALAEEILGGN